MDPVSLAYGVAGLVPLIGQAIKVTKEYRDAVVTPKPAVTNLIYELEALQLNATKLSEFLKSPTVTSDGLIFEHTSVLFSCSDNCEVRLRTLLEKLGYRNTSKLSRQHWPFNEKEEQKVSEEVRNYANWMHFSLSLDGCRLLSRSADDVARLLGQQLQQFKAIRSVEDRTSRIYDAVEENKMSKARNEILDWISPARFSHRHQILQQTRTEGTGRWILRTPEYNRWRDGVDQTNVLCCHGIKGAGKTNIVSVIIDDLRNRSSGTSPPNGVAFVYFDQQEQSNQTTPAVIRSILRQLLDRPAPVPEAVSNLYQASESGQRLTEIEFERLIPEVAKESGRVYIVIDAFDECTPDQRRAFLRTLSHMSRLEGLQLLITGRERIQDYTGVFPHHLSLQISAQDEDIGLYIRQELTRHGVYEMDGGPEFAKQLTMKLTAGAEGMFLLPVLQLRTILKENVSVGKMEERLKTLSHDLEGALEETIGRIMALPAGRMWIGMDTLLFLSHTARPMTAEELRDILSIHGGQRRVSVKHRASVKVILECCQGLATLDESTGDVRISHHSVQEYLIANDKNLFDGAEITFTVRCLKYIMFDDFNTGPWATGGEIQSRIDQYPFLAYATRHWGTHARRAERSDEVKAPLDEFFGSKHAMAVANQVRQYSMLRKEPFWSAEESLSFTPLHHACKHGLIETLKGLLDKKIYDINVATKQGTTPIIHAAASGHIKTVGVLMDRGANPYLCNGYGNALHCAVEANHPGTVRELVVKWGMDAKDALGHKRTYLGCALDRDSVNAFEELVKLGVDINTTTLWTRTTGGREASKKGLHIFHQACAANCYKIVELMIDRGWVDVNLRSSRGRTGLHCAADSHNPAVVMKLLKAGADISAKDNDGYTALDLAKRPHADDSGSRPARDDDSYVSRATSAPAR
ncbi:vegetative incompatibility protein HET-E-1 [Podospora aff. communis PSN243]|uniref:Vegetative incompatibility protein HET-E-1 n=1 Tax=Podospora aff. communis PSN243 TaxID=3040156 RepID=A0AAV9GQG5_9PEZI|nr:vegetative incompatibility protein HET-E-1 [Podospora aff. communis PSN243]